MAKNRNKNKKKKSGVVSMDTSEPTVSNFPQAMDTSESVAHKPIQIGLSVKMKKERLKKRSKNVRKMKAIAKAISSNDKAVEKVLKNKNKTTRIRSAKLLYD